MKKTLGALIAMTAMAATVGAAFAQQTPPTPEQQAKSTAENRHALFHVIGAAAGPALGLLRPGGTYNGDAVKLAGVRLEVLGGMIKPLTAVDTTKLVPKSASKPNVWTDRADFEAKADALVTAAGLLKASTDEASAKKAAQAVGGACKSCHDKFRVEEKH